MSLTMKESAFTVNGLPPELKESVAVLVDSPTPLEPEAASHATPMLVDVPKALVSSGKPETAEPPIRAMLAVPFSRKPYWSVIVKLTGPVLLAGQLGLVPRFMVKSPA